MATNEHLDEEDSGQIEAMLISAKMGNWDVVFDILESKPYLINCISYDRAWGVLHQAAWMNLFPIVKRLTIIPGCDPLIKTKQDLSSDYGPGKTPRDLSTNHVIKSFLSQAENRISTIKPKYPTFVSIQNELELTGRSISLALSCYKNLLCSELDFDDAHTFSFIMLTIFRECQSNWVTIKSKIGLDLQMYDLCLSNFVMHGSYHRKCIPMLTPDTMEDFFDRVIKSFTMERNRIYESINVSLALQGNKLHTPKGYDIVLSVYAILLNSLLMYWRSLNRCKRYTYRCIAISPVDLSKYRVGKVFTWLNFASSSVELTVAKQFNKGNITFKIDNGTSSRWSPKYIASHSFHPEEEECLYPCGARFIVTKVEGTNIELKLYNYL